MSKQKDFFFNITFCSLKYFITSLEEEKCSKIGENVEDDKKVLTLYMNGPLGDEDRDNPSEQTTNQ